LINKELFYIAEQTVQKLKEHGFKVATAESCTGGMVSSFITSVSGVSEVFELGVTSYSNRIKHEILGVDSETLDKYGAVSEQTAKEMAAGIRKLSCADIGISVTGVAGPDGSEGHPPGYVFIALDSEEKTIAKLLNIDPESRNFVREKAVEAVFGMINKYIEEL